jgi:hypothetical protein
VEIKDYIIFGLSLALTVCVLWLYFEIKTPDFTETREIDSTKTTTVDTVRPPDTSRTLETDVESPDTVYTDTLIITKRDTFRVQDSTEENFQYTQIRDYRTTVSDTLLTGVIKTTVQGYLINQNFTYTPEYPIEIKVNTETRITETITKTEKLKPHPYLIVGGLSVEGKLGYEIGGGWQFSNGNSIEASYSPTFNGGRIGVQYNLQNLFR